MVAALRLVRLDAPASRRAARLAVAVTLVLFAGLLPAPVLAHSVLAGDPHERAAALVTALALFAFWACYLRGQHLRAAGRGRALLFHGTAVLALIVLLGPLDDWAKTSTAAHMTQHMLLMVVIAPLWVLAHPLPQLLRGGGRLVVAGLSPLLRLSRHPLLAAHLHAVMIWFWHAPRFYMLAVEQPWWHALEHACFLLSAALFWWAVLRASARAVPWALLALILTLMHTGFLGALLTFADTPVYGEARSLQDQQLAGLIMWVVGAVPYLLAAAWLSQRWYVQLRQRMRAAD